MLKIKSSSKFHFHSSFSGILMIFVLAHLVHHILTALQIPLLPFIRSEFGLNYAQTGFLISAFSLPYGISQIPAGWIADHLGRPLLVAIGISGVALFGFLIGFSQTYIAMVIFFALMGLVAGAYHPASIPLIVATVKPDKQGQALGLHMIGGAFSYFVAPFFAAIFAKTFGWRSPFIWLSVPVMIFGIFMYWLTKKRENIKNVIASTTTNEKGKESILSCICRLMPFIFLSSFAQAVSFSIIAFIPLFMVDHFGISRELAAAMIALYYSAGLWASFVGGYLSDRFGAINATLVACLLSGPAIYLLKIAPYGWSFWLLLIFIGITSYIRFVTSESYIINQTTEKNRSTVIGIYYFGSMEGGGVITPVLGYLIDRYSFNCAFTIAAIAVFIVTLIFSLFLRRKHN